MRRPAGARRSWLRTEGLWREPDFLKLWAGETVSTFGDQITLLALPLTAILTLHAGAAEMGLLAAVGAAPIALFSLFAGVWVDRVRRRPILVAADVGRALALATVPAAFVLGVLTMAQLYVVAFVTGTLSVLFLIAYQSYLPSLVGREQLVDANAKMSATESVSQLAGPGLAGLLVQLFTAPLPVIFDALSFLASVLGLVTIRRREPSASPRARGLDLRSEIQEGMAALLGHPALRVLFVSASVANLFASGQLALFLLFLTRDVGLVPSQIGLVLGLGSLGSIAGAVTAVTAAKRIGTGPSFVWGAGLFVAGGLLRGFASGSALVATATLVAAQLAFSVGLTWWNVNAPALRQAVVPAELLGRVNATWRFGVWGVGPVGALLGGAAGQVIGLRPAMIAGGVGGAIALAIISASSLPRQRTIAPAMEISAEGV